MLSFLRSFRRPELYDLGLASLLVMGVTLAMIFTHRTLRELDLLVVLAVVIGGLINFLGHELAHKFMAIRLGAISNFKIVKEGALLTALAIIPFNPIRVIAPGAVQVSGFLAPEQNAKISLVGPLANLFFASGFLLAAGILSVFVSDAGVVVEIMIFLAYFSSYICFFNLLPFGPLDGLEIFRWDRDTYYVLMGITVATWITLTLLSR